MEDMKNKSSIFVKGMTWVGLNAERTRQIRRALGFVRPHRKTVAIIMAIMPIIAALGALEPLIYKLVFDRLSGHEGVGSVLMAVGAIMVAAMTGKVSMPFPTVSAGGSGWR